MSEVLRVEQFNREKVLEGMMRDGAVSVPLIHDNFRKALEIEAKRSQRLPWVSGETFCSAGNIDLFKQTGAALGELVQNNFGDCLDKEFSFNILGLNTYRFLGALAPHADGGYRGMVCIVVIDGRARFYSSPTGDYEDFYQTRRQIPNDGGDVIFMRAYGFQETKQYIIHQVGWVKSLRRDSLLLRWSSSGKG